MRSLWFKPIPLEPSYGLQYGPCTKGKHTDWIACNPCMHVLQVMYNMHTYSYAHEQTIRPPFNIPMPPAHRKRSTNKQEPSGSIHTHRHMRSQADASGPVGSAPPWPDGPAPPQASGCCCCASSSASSGSGISGMAPGATLARSASYASPYAGAGDATY